MSRLVSRVLSRSERPYRRARRLRRVTRERLSEALSAPRGYGLRSTQPLGRKRVALRGTTSGVQAQKTGAPA